VLLLIIVIGGLIWLDPTALLRRGDPNLPWNEEFRLVKADEEVAAPSEEQPQITGNLLFQAWAMQEDSRRGKIGMVIRRDGRIEGAWAGEYHPQPNVDYTIMGCKLKGNIDPSKIYSDETGEDPSQLYFITRGKFIILAVNTETSETGKVAGRLYVTGWLDTEYNATGKVTMTSDKRSFEMFSWQAEGSEERGMFDFLQSFPIR